jgi:hypothetical protein
MMFCYCTFRGRFVQYLSLAPLIHYSLYSDTASSVVQVRFPRTKRFDDDDDNDNNNGKHDVVVGDF